MVKIRNFCLYIVMIFGTISTVSAKGFFTNSYAVSFDETLEHVQVRAELMDKDKTYQKRYYGTKSKCDSIQKMVKYELNHFGIGKDW